MTASRTVNIIKNAVGAYLVRGCSLVVSFVAMPLNLSYFGNQEILGAWFTILSVVNWFILFDFGIGNGLRNELTVSLARDDKTKTREIVSSAYYVISVVSVIVCIVVVVIESALPWNDIFSVPETSISQDTLMLGMRIVTVGMFLQLCLRLVTSVLYAMQKSAIVNACSLFSSCFVMVYLLVAPSGNAPDALIALSWVQALAMNLPLLLASIVVFGGKLRYAIPIPSCVTIDAAKSVLGLGLKLLWLTLIALIVLTTHPVLITQFIGSGAVVEYQIYYQVFNTVAGVVVLALIPVWSAVTKAAAEDDFEWIEKAHITALKGAVGALFLMGIIAVFLQPCVDIWLRDATIQVDLQKSLIFVLYGSFYVLHNVNTSFDNGLPYLRFQFIGMTFAAIAVIPSAWLFTQVIGNWSGVVLGATVALAPYELFAPFFFRNHLKKMQMLDSRL